MLFLICNKFRIINLKKANAWVSVILLFPQFIFSQITYLNDSILTSNKSTNTVVWKEEIIAQNLTAFESYGNVCFQPVQQTELKKLCRPTDLQFYPRNKSNLGLVHFAGTSESNQKIFIKVTKKSIFNISDSTIYPVSIHSNNYFDTIITINAELSEYSFSYRLNNETLFTNIANKVVCGDAFIISGQSNAVAQDTSKILNQKIDSLYGKNSVYGKYGRSFGNGIYGFCSNWNYPSPNNYQSTNWCSSELGIIGLSLQYNLIKKQNIPICILNNALGNTQISDHMLDSTITENKQFYFEYKNCLDGISAWNFKSIFGFLNRRIYLAGLENGIIGFIWYQGESDIINSGNQPTYSQKFSRLYKDLKKYTPSIRKTFLVQIHSNPRPSDSLKIISFSEEQRNLPNLFTNREVVITSSNSVKYPNCSGIHFSENAYFEIADRLFKQITNELYDINYNINCSPPNIINVELDKISKTLVLTFNQNINLNSDNPIDIAKSLYLSNNCILSNPYIDNNKFIVSVDKTDNLFEISYLGHLPCTSDNTSPGCNSQNIFDQSFSYNWWCPTYIRNNYNIAALSFGNFRINQNCFSCYDFSKSSLIVFPNPSIDGFIRLINNKNVIKDIIIYNSLGQEIMSFKNIFSNDTQINIESSEAASLYFMKIIYENETNEVRKIKR